MLKTINVQIAEGTLNAIVGPSGSGKSTLLKILGGFESVSAGQVVVGRHHVSRMKDKALELYRRRYVGFLHQTPTQNLFPDLSVERNLTVSLQLKGVERSLRKREARRLLDSVGLKKHLSFRAGNLSGGEAQRLGISMALAGNPLLILADEPTAELDTATATHIIELFQEINREMGHTFVITTHDERMAQLCDTYRIKNGRLVTSVLGASKTFDSQLHIDELCLVDKGGCLTLPQTIDEVAHSQSFVRVRYNEEERHIELFPPEVQLPPLKSLDPSTPEILLPFNHKKAMPVYKLEQVSKRYTGKSSVTQVLKKVDLVITEGSFNVIMGPSGSGKSTLLSLLAGIETASEGKLWLFGRELGHLSIPEQVQLRRDTIGIVFQFFNLLPNLTVSENIEFPMILSNRSLEERKKKVAELEALMGLIAVNGHLPSELSGGERQRVGIARALANDPKILLADEPTGNLDAQLAKPIMNLFVKLSNPPHNKTVILVTHDPSIIQPEMRVLHLTDGRLS